jgi:GGDEF domain-containing protein
VGTYKELEQELKEKLAQEHSKLVETAKEILRNQQILEKLHRAPFFLQEICKATNLSEFLAKTVDIMCHKEGLGYARVAVLLIEGDDLRLAYSNQDFALRHFSMKKQHKFAQVARGETRIISEATGECVLPIISPMQIEGVLQILFEETERILLIENETIKKAHLDLLEWIARSLGICFMHFRRTEKESYYAAQDELTETYHLSYLLHTMMEYMKSSLHFSLILLKSEQEGNTSLEEKNGALNKLAKILKEHAPKDSLLARIGIDELGMIAFQSALADPIHWARQLKNHCKKNNPTLHFSIGIANFTGEEKQKPLLWKAAIACIKKAEGSSGIRIFYWDEKEDKIKEAMDRVATRLV